MMFPRRCVIFGWIVAVASCGRFGFDDRLSDGSACAANTECTETCIANSCQPFSPRNGPCDDLDTDDCEPGDVCASARCVGGSGQSCAANADCAETCISSGCGPRSASGGACDDPADCAVIGDSCDATGTCVSTQSQLQPPTLAAGVWHTCAIAAGALKCWGDNSAGQLGDATIAERHVPTVVTGMATGVTAVAAGEFHSCALQNGGVKCWGAQYGSGRLGDNGVTATYAASPVQVVGLTSGVISVAAGYYHSCALMADRTVRCWGFPTSALGAGPSVANTAIPNEVRNPTNTGPLTGVTKLIASPDGYHTCAVVGGAAYCWGDNQTGALGDNTLTERYLPTPMAGLASGVVDVAANINFTCAVLGSGEMRCTGTNASGQLGNTTTTDSRVPIAVQAFGGSMPHGLAAGNSHACVTAAGGVWCWGGNSNSELGATSSSTCLGSFPCHLVPLQVVALPAGSGALGLTAGGGHTCAVFAAGTLRCWGRNTSGELGNNSTTTTATPVTPTGF